MEDTIQYEDPTMILTKSRVTIGLLGLVIVTLSTMMIFVILSVRIDVKTDEPEPLYVIIPESATSRVGEKFRAPATNTSSMFLNEYKTHGQVFDNSSSKIKFARN